MDYEPWIRCGATVGPWLDDLGHDGRLHLDPHRPRGRDFEGRD